MTPSGKPLLPFPIIENEPPPANRPPAAILPEISAAVEKLTIPRFPEIEPVPVMPVREVRVEELTLRVDPLLVIWPPLLWKPTLLAQTVRGNANKKTVNSLAGLLIMNSSVRGPRPEFRRKWMHSHSRYDG